MVSKGEVMKVTKDSLASSRNDTRKVFILGLDGATFDIMEPLMEKGELPNIASIVGEGVYAYLNSTVLPHSPSAWTTFATGKNPGKHGIIGFRKMRNVC